jgi:hypothetical protein
MDFSLAAIRRQAMLQFGGARLLTSRWCCALWSAGSRGRSLRQNQTATEAPNISLAMIPSDTFVTVPVL